MGETGDLQIVKGRFFWMPSLCHRFDASGMPCHRNSDPNGRTNSMDLGETGGALQIGGQEQSRKLFRFLEYPRSGPRLPLLEWCLWSLLSCVVMVFWHHLIFLKNMFDFPLLVLQGTYCCSTYLYFAHGNGGPCGC